MGLIDNLKNRFTAPMREQIKEELKKDLEKSFMGDIASWETVTGIPPTFNRKLIYDHYKSWVYANIEAIAEPVASIQFELFRVAKGDKVTEIKNHEVLRLLNRVNNYTTKHDLIFMTVQHLLLQGEAAWFLLRGDGGKRETPKQILVLDPGKITIYPDKDKGGVNHYDYLLKDGSRMRLEPWDVIFFKKPNPKDPYRGIGVVEAAFTTIQSDDFAEEWNRNFFYNSARPDVILKTEQKLNPETSKRMKEEWKSLYKGARNSNKTALLEAGLSIDTLTKTAKEMDFLESMKWNRDKIMALFKNTKIALGIVEDVNRANAEASELLHNKRVIKPMMQMITDALNEFLVPFYKRDIFLGFEDPVSENREDLMNEFEKGWNKWWTINEIKDRLGEESIGPAGDIMYLPLNLMPIGSEDSEKEFKTIIKEIKVKPTDQGQRRLKRRYTKEIQRIHNQHNLIAEYDKIKLETAKALAKLLIKKKKLIKKDKTLIQDLKPIERVKYMEKYWQGLIRLASPIEKRFYHDLRKRVYPKLEEEVIEKLSKAKKSARTKANVDRFMFDIKKAIELTIAVVLPILTRAVLLGGEKGMSLAGVDLEYIESSSFIQGFLRNNTRKFSKAYTTTMTQQLRATLADGLKAGEGLDLLKKRVRGTFGRLSETQAWRLARTETFKAINASTIDAWRQTGIVEGKQWFTAMDERVCQWCAPMEGKVFGLEQTVFDKGTELRGSADGVLPLNYEDISYPPLHPSCRCTYSPIIVGTKKIEPKQSAEQIKKIVKDVIKEYDEPEEDS